MILSDPEDHTFSSYGSVTEVSCEFHKLTQKSAFTSKGISPNLDDSKIFANVTGPYVKLNQKNDGEVAVAVRATLFK